MGSIASPAMMAKLLKPQKARCRGFDSSEGRKERPETEGRSDPNMCLSQHNHTASPGQPRASKLLLSDR